ncbi:MAG TPA: hypothetical protein VGM63_01200 [Mucilaginibacter sp.]|jgi:hypothetical protein
MGSSGSGALTDYTNSKSTNSKSTTGGSSGEDNCGKAFEANLEEVARCDYFTTKGVVPPVGTKVVVNFRGIRLAVTTTSGQEIGYLPTKYNYIKVCIDNGFSYGGEITNSSITPTPSVLVDIAPI